MIRSIAHFGDYHIHNNKWHERYDIGNDRIYEMLKKSQPDRILIAGDLFESYVSITNEGQIFASDFLKKLSKIAKVVIIDGNHDIMKKNLNRVSSIKTIVDIMKNDNIVYYRSSGFYEDENVVWVIHSHLEKSINPWQHIVHERQDNKTYIDVWHDPINGCIADNGNSMTSKSYRNLSDFEGDLGMFADIHKFQYLDKNETKAYCSSTFQQTMGESVTDHGFLLWDIESRSSEFIVVPDEYKLITFNVGVGQDYDDIHFSNDYATNKANFRIVWRDYSSNINNINELKITNYLKDKWGTVDILFDKTRLYNEVGSDGNFTEALDLTDSDDQQTLFKEYLDACKYDDTFIEEILKIDDIVNELLDITPSKNIDWGIDKLWVDNFKSYDKFEINFDKYDKGIIIQVGGENQQGKSTILDAITYISHGTTIFTNKLGGAQREKHSDNKYINNKRDLNYCEGGMVIDVNGVKYTVIRRTERKMNKNNKISSVSTNLEYYNGVDITDDKKLRGEQKKDTQNILNDVMGEFDEFIRLTLTNSENLNHLISLDRATFIDSIIRDAGLSVFEQKLTEFKKYKETKNKNKINLNLLEKEDEVKIDIVDLELHKKNYYVIIDKNSEADKILASVNVERDDEMKKLDNIENFNDFDLDVYNKNMITYKSEIEEHIIEQEKCTNKLKGLKTEFDKEKYDNFLKNIIKIDDDVLNLKLKKNGKEVDIEKEKTNIIRVDDKINQLKEKEIIDQKSKKININYEIEKINNKFTSTIETTKTNYINNKKDQELNIKSYNIELKDITSKENKLKTQIVELENSKICPTCEREYDENQKDIIVKNINKCENELIDIVEELKKVNINIQTNEKIINDIVCDVQKLDDGIFTEDLLILEKEKIGSLDENNNKLKKIDIVCEEIKNDVFVNVPTLNERIDKGIGIKTASVEKINILKQDVKSFDVDVDVMEDKKSNIQKETLLLEKDKEEVKLYEFILQKSKELVLKIENVKLNVNLAKNKIEKYDENLKSIEKNKLIEKKLEIFDNDIKILNDEKLALLDELSDVKEASALLKEKIKENQKNIILYKKQVKQDSIFKEYSKCISRDGLPTYLLQKSKDLINNELEDMLTNVDFNVFFDDELKLKMYSKNRKDITQCLLSSSGKERTFGAIALKMALRTINTNSRPNLLLMDEVMLKLKNHSIEEFNNMLLSLKTKIDKILIIEHVHDVPFDVFITVEKDENGVSSLAIS